MKKARFYLELRKNKEIGQIKLSVTPHKYNRLTCYIRRSVHAKNWEADKQRMKPGTVEGVDTAEMINDELKKIEEKAYIVLRHYEKIGTKATSERFKIDLRENIQSNNFVIGDVAYYYDMYLKSLKDISYSSFIDKQQAGKFLIPCAISEIDKNYLQAITDRMNDRYATGTIKKNITHLKKYLHWLMDNGYIKNIRPLAVKSINGINIQEKKSYLMIDGRGMVKIGRSNMPLKRERTLQSQEPETKLIHIFPDDIEKELHEKYKDKRVRGEWFELSDNEVQQIINEFSN